MENALISVIMITYGHEKFIQEAINGVLMQECSFGIELIIANDCSPDNTAEVIRNIVKKHPRGSWIKYIEHEKNIGMMPNFVFALNKAKGKYIAMCDGDDYWTDPYKLQKQVDFLEKNKEYGLVHHEADFFFQKSEKTVKNHHQTNKIFPSTGFVFEELLYNNNIYTPTVMFKSSLLKHFMGIDENVRNKFFMGDYVMWLEFSQHCKFYYIPVSMVTYRVLESSASKSTSYEKDLSFLNSYYDIKLFFMNRFNPENFTIKIIEQGRLTGSLSNAIKYKKNKEARYFASKIQIDNLKILLKRIIVFVPFLFRYILKRKML
jgi:glycosyltransferase involved in cell wall biosynthesis